MSLVKRKKLDSDNFIDGSTTGRAQLSHADVILEGHDGPVLAARFNNQGTHLASAGHDKRILLWEVASRGQEMSSQHDIIRGHRSAVTSVRWSRDDLSIVTSSVDGTVAYWDSITGRKVRSCRSKSIVNEVDVNNENLAVSVDDEGSTNIWDIREKKPTATFNTSFPALTCTFNKKGNMVYLSGIDPKLRAFDMRKFEVPLWETSGQYDSLTSISINHDDSMLVAKSMDGTVLMFNARDVVPNGFPRLNSTIYKGAPAGKENYLIRARFGVNKVSIYSGSEDFSTTVWDIKSANITHKLTGHSGTVIDLDIHPQGELLASTSTDGTVILRGMP